MESGLAFGPRTLWHGVVFLLNGRRGLAFPVMQYRKEVAKLVEILRHPQGHVARGPVAGPEAPAPIGGQARADELVVLKRFTMRSPGVSRPIRRQLAVEDRRASGVKGHQNGRVDGKNLLAERKHQGF